MEESNKGIYQIILVRYIVSQLQLNITFSKNFINAGYGPLKWSTSSMIYLGTYEFKDSNKGKITPEGYFNITYVDEVY